MMDRSTMQETILKFAEQEFLKKGFADASYDHIAEASGLTLQECKELYTDKKELFTQLVSQTALELKRKLSENQDTYFDLFRTYRISESKKLFTEFFKNFIDYIYDHFDTFKLIIFRSAGSPYEEYIYEIIRMDAARAEEYFGELRRNGRLSKDISHEFHHMISSAYFTGAFETIAHDMTRDQAIKYVSELSVFFFKGWEALLKS